MPSPAQSPRHAALSRASRPPRLPLGLCLPDRLRRRPEPAPTGPVPPLARGRACRHQRLPRLQFVDGGAKLVDPLLGPLGAADRRRRSPPLPAPTARASPHRVLQRGQGARQDGVRRASPSPRLIGRLPDGRRVCRAAVAGRQVGVGNQTVPSRHCRAVAASGDAASC